MYQELQEVAAAMKAHAIKKQNEDSLIASNEHRLVGLSIRNEDVKRASHTMPKMGPRYFDTPEVARPGRAMEFDSLEPVRKSMGVLEKSMKPAGYESVQRNTEQN